MLIVDDPAQAAADRLAAAIAAGSSIALSGGNTPRPAYEKVAEAGLDWSACTLWFGDDRAVPPDDERSNYRLVRESILDRLGDPGPDVRRIRGEDGADDAAAAYEAELRDAFGDGVPEIDMILLGIGPDGHTASLFPGKPGLNEVERLVVGVPEAGQPPYVPRVTMTLPVLNASREVVFLIAGAEKAPLVAGAFGDDPDPVLPAANVKPASGRLTLILDPAAAAEL